MRQYRNLTIAWYTIFMFSDPEKNIAQFFLKDGMIVADFGAGTGAYAVAAAKRVGERGRVYAIDVQKELLPSVKTAAAKAGLSNIEILWGDIEELYGTKMADKSADAAIISNVLFQSGNKSGLLNEAGRILKGGGMLLLVDWVDSFGGLGPHSDHVIKKNDARRMLEDAGFAYERDIDAGEHHYGMVFRKP